MVETHGRFIEVFVSTSLELCEARDRKGLYAKARAGMIKEFTGIDDPYEVPQNPELIIDTAICTPLEAANRILSVLQHQHPVIRERIETVMSSIDSDATKRLSISSNP